MKSLFHSHFFLERGRSTGIIFLSLSGSHLEYIQPPLWPLPIDSGCRNALLLFGWGGGNACAFGEGTFGLRCKPAAAKHTCLPRGCPWRPSVWAALRHQLSSGPCPLCPPALPACPSPCATATRLPGGSDPPTPARLSWLRL